MLGAPKPPVSSSLCTGSHRKEHCLDQVLDGSVGPLTGSAHGPAWAHVGKWDLGPARAHTKRPMYVTVQGAEGRSAV